MSQWDRIKEVLYARIFSPIPDDMTAAVEIAPELRPVAGTILFDEHSFRPQMEHMMLLRFTI